MQYKTIILEFLQDHPTIHDQLAKNRALPSTLDRYATLLKSSHDSWKEQLSQLKPESDPLQIEGEALEIAIKETENRFHSEFPTEQDETLSLYHAMAFLRRHTPTE